MMGSDHTSFDNAEIYLKHYIGRGQAPSKDHFCLRPAINVSPLQEGQVRVTTLFLAMSPSLRFSLNEDSAATCSKGRIDEGSTLGTDGVGLVVESTSKLFRVGDVIANKPHTMPWPWRTSNVFSDRDMFGLFFLVEAAGGQGWLRSFPEAAVSYLGISALTSYFGVVDVLKAHLITEAPPGAKASTTLVVSGASGACGSVAGQIAKIIGFHRVVGITSDDTKLSYVTEELGFHAGVLNTSKSVDELAAALAVACPDGIDCYFDNVGGDVSTAVASLLNPGAQVAVCGEISQMRDGGKDQSWVKLARERGASVRWFRYTSYMDDDERLSDARNVLEEWARSGRLRLRITYFDGLEQAPACFESLFTNSKIGKALVRVSPSSCMADGDVDDAPKTEGSATIDSKKHDVAAVTLR